MKVKTGVKAGGNSYKGDNGYDGDGNPDCTC